MAPKLERGRQQPPLYAQVTDHLRDRIARRYRAGDRLESEPQLVKELGVSRATVIRAVQLLEQEGLVRREQGRGTFIAAPRFDRQLPDLSGFSEHIDKLGHEPSHRVLDAQWQEPDPQDALLAVFDEPVLVLRRLRLVDAKPVGLHRLGLPEAIALRIGAPASLSSTSASLYALFDRHGVGLAQAQESLRASAVTPDEAAHLDAPAGTPLMDVLRFSTNTEGRLVEAVDARYLGDFYEYRVHLVRTTGRSSTPKERDDAVATSEPVGGRDDGGGRLRLG